ncbi:type II toxin-antitoxin system PemK/MazF family toxin [Brevibacterium litoralis]|uniref:type II toxin-antitoxin system PemK/MazF family toxin n=1 Tax=Brevibacterium litoralis TaxID=3138935 RepID=UPI0032EF7CB3
MTLDAPKLRGDIWDVEFDPAQDGEVAKTRPAVIVSNNGANRAATAAREGGVFVVVPLTSNTRRVMSFQTRVPADAGNGLDTESKTHPEQLRAVHVRRLVRRRGRLGAEFQGHLDASLMDHLAL